jgi:hypothetical protein
MPDTPAHLRRRWSVSLRELLLLIALAGTALGWWGYANRHQEEMMVGAFALHHFEVLRSDPNERITHGFRPVVGKESFWITVTRQADKPELPPNPVASPIDSPATQVDRP